MKIKGAGGVGVDISERQLLILAGLGLAAVLYAGYQAKKVTSYVLNDGFNITSENNIAHTAAGAIVGKENLDNGLNIIFARATLLNPFASAQAKKEARNYLDVWG